MCQFCRPVSNQEGNWGQTTISHDHDMHEQVKGLETMVLEKLRMGMLQDL